MTDVNITHPCSTCGEGPHGRCPIEAHYLYDFERRCTNPHHAYLPLTEPRHTSAQTT